MWNISCAIGDHDWEYLYFGESSHNDAVCLRCKEVVLDSGSSHRCLHTIIGTRRKVEAHKINHNLHPELYA